MKIDAAGWLNEANKKISPNFDKRPSTSTIELLVIHNISLPPNVFEGDAVERFFLNQLDPQAHPYFETIADIKVSAHLFIRRDGEIIQFVSFNDRAWHAGQSCFQGRSGCNDYSIGIELEGSDEQPYSDKQYLQLQQVTEALHQRYPKITAERISGHEHIAPGRKTDPGPSFDWRRFLSNLSFNSQGLAKPSQQDTLTTD